MIRRPPRSTRPATLFPYTTLFRSRLGPRKVATTRVPIVIEQRLAGGLLRSLAGAINGGAIARGTSFLKDRMGERIFPAGMNVVDDALRPRGLASKPFDAEGLATRRTHFVADGILGSWVLDLYAARKLGLARSEERRVGTECGRTGRTRWWPMH